MSDLKVKINPGADVSALRGEALPKAKREVLSLHPKSKNGTDYTIVRLKEKDQVLLCGNWQIKDAAAYEESTAEVEKAFEKGGFLTFKPEINVPIN